MRRLLVRIADIGVVLLPLMVFAGGVAAYLTLIGIKEFLPPKALSMAVGRPGGGYDAIAQDYRRILARDGITLDILDTAGSMENSRLLARGAADVALIQGGVPVSEETRAEALAAVFVEPFFIFHRTDMAEAADPASWGGLRIAAGEPGGGTRMALNALIEGLGLGLDQSRFLPLGGADAARALLQDNADVAIFVAPIDAPYLAPLLADPDRIAIASLRDTAALSRRLPFVRSVDIPAAGLDYAARIPAERVPLTAMIATLAAQGDLHPALVNRLVRAAEEIHSGPVLLSDTLSFPSAEGASLPMNPQARAALSSEPGLLERILPYWVAAQITRVTVLLVPLLVLLVPLLRAVPGLYEWRMRSRVYRRYGRLTAIDAEAAGGLDDARRDALLGELDAMDAEAKSLEVPVKYRDAAYNLRLHIDLVRRRISAARSA